MVGAKRMSNEEKRQVILGIYHERKSVFSEKEILELAKKSGINQNTVADVNNSLVDDGLVDREKIGGMNYFWSFPAKNDFLLRKNHEKNLKELEDYKIRVVEAETKLAEAKKGREEDSGDRADKLTRLATIEKEQKDLVSQIEKLKENNPQFLANLQKDLNFVKEGANRWTDNIFECKSYLVKKRGFSNKEAYKLLKIPEDFDYPEESR